MKLVFVHGRAQEKKSSEQLRQEWSSGLARGFAEIGAALDPKLEIQVPYYGQLLYDLTYERDRVKVEKAITRGPEDAGADDTPLDTFEPDFLYALAIRAGITEAEIRQEELQVRVEAAPPGGDLTTPRGPGNWEITHALGRLLSRKAPWLAEQILARVTADVKTYLTRPAVARAVDEMIRPVLEADRCIVVAHSLGSVISYINLRAARSRADVPLFLTLGSPLGAPVVKDKIVPPVLAVPEGVESWVNGTDERDYVALWSRLDRDSFADGIVNYTDIHNRHDWPHSIEDYLADREIAGHIANALAAG